MLLFDKKHKIIWKSLCKFSTFNQHMRKYDFDKKFPKNVFLNFLFKILWFDKKHKENITFLIFFYKNVHDFFQLLTKLSCENRILIKNSKIFFYNFQMHLIFKKMLWTLFNLWTTYLKIRFWEKIQKNVLLNFFSKYSNFVSNIQKTEICFFQNFMKNVSTFNKLVMWKKDFENPKKMLSNKIFKI